MELITGALAAFFLWTVIRFLLPIRLPDRLALPLYGALAYGVLAIPSHKVTVALACAGSLVFLHLIVRLLGATPPPQTLEVHLPVRHRAHSMKRVPGEAPSAGRIGRRIPSL